jgi:hypothetical protein
LPLFFLDTSALTKYYHRESGSEFVEGLFSDNGVRRLISRLTVVEIESAFAIKARTGAIGPKAAIVARRRLESDLARRNILMATVADEHSATARSLSANSGFRATIRCGWAAKSGIDSDPCGSRPTAVRSRQVGGFCSRKSGLPDANDLMVRITNPESNHIRKA